MPYNSVLDTLDGALSPQDQKFVTVGSLLGMAEWATKMRPEQRVVVSIGGVLYEAEDVHIGAIGAGPLYFEIIAKTSPLLDDLPRPGLRYLPKT